MAAVTLSCVSRRDVASRLAQLMHVASRIPLGIIAPKHANDSPNLPRPHISCVVLPSSTYAAAKSKLERGVDEARPDLEELRHAWSCEYLGYDTGADGPDPRFSVTLFKLPRGQEVAFVSLELFTAIHDGGPVTTSPTVLEHLS